MHGMDVGSGWIPPSPRLRAPVSCRGHAAQEDEQKLGMAETREGSRVYRGAGLGSSPGCTGRCRGSENWSWGWLALSILLEASQSPSRYPPAKSLRSSDVTRNREQRMELGSHTAQPTGQSYILSLQKSLNYLGIMQRAPGTAWQPGSVAVFCADN